MTEPADRAQRSGSFGAVAEDYNRFRPGPPESAVAWLLPAEPRVAVDLGAGTGALSEMLARWVPHVVAVEPDPRMASVLGRRVPSAQLVVARAEAIPLRDLSADLVGVSSAWHWMDEAHAVAEAARVLRPGGVLGVLWSGPDRSVRWVAEVLGALRNPTPRPEGQPARSRRELEVPTDGPFEIPQGRTFTASMQYRVDELVGLAASYSSVITLPEADRAVVLARVADLVAEQPNLRNKEWVTLPVRCACWRAVRRADTTRGANPLRHVGS